MSHGTGTLAGPLDSQLSRVFQMEVPVSSMEVTPRAMLSPTESPWRGTEEPGVEPWATPTFNCSLDKAGNGGGKQTRRTGYP